MNGGSLKKTKSLFTKLLEQFTPTKCLKKTKQFHALTVTSGLQSTNFQFPLVTAKAQCGRTSYARKLFEEMPKRNLFFYNTLIKMYSRNGSSYDALNLFVEMLRFEVCRPDNYTYPFVIKACSDVGLRKLGVAFHGRTLVDGIDMDGIVQNCLIAMYMSFGEVEVARKVFDAMRDRNVVTWNTMISGYFRNGYARQALTVFDWMVKSGQEPDCASVVSVLPVCGYLKEVDVGRRVHALMENGDLGKKITAWNALVDMYVRCGNLNEAQVVFDRMSERDVITWTSMINGYILNGEVRNALGLFRMMQFEWVRPNSVTIASLLSACSSFHYLKNGRCLHGWTIRQKLECEVVVETALIDMYAKCNRVELSFRVFARTSKKKTVPWNAILSGCVHNGLTREAVELFKQMQMAAVQPNDATLNSLLRAYAILADLQQAMNIHGYLIISGFLSNVEIATGLIDIYSKCGSLESAHKIFSGISTKDKDIILWSVIIAGYGMHGNGEAAVSLFKEMVQSGMKPNDVTFTSALHACSHSGLVDEGLDLFKFMLENHHPSPCADHYTCIVDLLGRAGRLDEAYDLIRTMPLKPTHAVWGALLGACVIHENVELGEVAAEWLFELEPENTGNYVLLSKIYAAVGRWKDVENVRDRMNEIGLRKTPAHSLIEVRNM
ncbi:pentatricopeptide repeat-containing protein At5g39350-like [Pistacia vera]|uniref:pentatricopeptide repeat-containing protein At5g39350-like n=1 Tax=Pistacia vera TaxID=55513 RepID=UPI0012630CA7|nr:pentatricopeptide repeat-containing protein At5g39350-like [Pistacia vera]